MPGSNQLPLAVAALLLATAVALLLAASAVPVAAGKYGGGGRMVIVRAPGARAVVVAAGAGARNNRWYDRRRLEDEVAPEFGGLLLGAGQDHISDHALHPDRPACGEHCPAPGEPYTRPCSAFNHCRGG